MSKTYLPESDNPGAGAVRDGRVRAVREFNRAHHSFGHDLVGQNWRLG